LFTKKNSYRYAIAIIFLNFAGVVEKISSINDHDFEAMRTAFGKTQKKSKLQGQSSHKLNDPANLDQFTGPWGRRVSEPSSILTGPSEVDLLNHSRQKESSVVVSCDDRMVKAGEEKTISHQQNQKDYMGRTFMHVPTDLDVRLDKETGSFECFAPKRIVHTWTGHSKGVNAIRFFPNSGHLLLSASQDCRIKVKKLRNYCIYCIF